ncbi:hypothetical protein J2I47_22835 [Fibrella sp. HMF5335]|uniref:DUF115 domain-containing protein n=1 Tax=Fibrella rubiginis TaxID=2817060 RepID=A0A939GKA4_9BACT|nr:hypothetical protein [Fibrella rubiginis]MBO0939403.1 hypothetical protein [Fibrella rubiginis]
MLENLVNAVSGQITTFISTLASLLKILIKSRFSVDIPAPQRPVCAILGNGPSLRQSLENDLAFIREAELYCVNNFASSPEYALLQPMNYALLDPAFFLYSEQNNDRKDVEKTIRCLVNMTTWPMNLFVPQSARGCYLVQQLTGKHPNGISHQVKTVFYNYTVVRGYAWFRHFVFRKGWGMPQSQNILAASLYLAITRRFTDIYLFGADHSWHEEIRVSDANELLMKQEHFYDKPGDATHIPIYDVVKKETSRMSAQFASLSKAFYSYEILRDYAQYMNVRVLNASAKSYVDAFTRIKI